MASFLPSKAKSDLKKKALLSRKRAASPSKQPKVKKVKVVDENDVGWEDLAPAYPQVSTTLPLKFSYNSAWARQDAAADLWASLLPTLVYPLLRQQARVGTIPPLPPQSEPACQEKCWIRSATVNVVSFTSQFTGFFTNVLVTV